MKILVFDSLAERRDALKGILLSLGYEEPQVKPGDEPLDILRFLEKSSLPDIVFCAGEEGVSLCSKWKIEESELLHDRVYMIYVGEKEDNFLAPTLAGVDDILIWPTTPKILEARILLAEKRRLDKEESDLDPLTKVLNRKAFETNLAKEMERAYRKQGQVGFVFIDVDNFKEVNDNFGHYQGDMLLCELADRMKKSTRQYDYVGRIGGDEFAILFVDCTPEDARKRAELLREAISSKPLVEEIPLKLTVSMGLAVSRIGERNPTRLMKKADRLMYEAKKGKNRNL